MKMHSARRYIGVSFIALALGAATQAARAQQAADGSPDPTGAASKNAGEVVVTGQRLEVPLTVPYSESVIGEEAIKALQAAPDTTVETLLNSQPSIVAVSGGPNGTRTKIFFRSFSSGEFTQTFDGISLDDIFNAGFSSQADNAFNTQLDLDNVSGVEVFNGVNNPATNGYNSLGGTINFLPAQPSDKFGGLVSGGGGSFNSTDWHVALNTGDLGGLKQLFSFRHDTSDGWQQFTPVQHDNAYWALAFSGGGATDVANYFIWNSTRGYSPNYVPMGLGSAFNFSPNIESQYGHDTNWNDVLDFKTQLASNVTLSNKIFGGFVDNARVDFENPAFLKGKTQPYTLDDDTPQSSAFWLNDPVGYPAGPTYNPAAVFGSAKAGTDYNSYQYSGWQAGYQPSVTVTVPHNVITFGGNITFGELHSAEAVWGTDNVPHIIGYNDLWDEHDSRLMASGYIQDQITLFDDRLTILPGVKYLFAATKNSDAIGIYYGIGGTESDGEHYVSPTVSLSYQVMPELAAYFAYGQNIKFPDISAYYNASTNQANSGPQAGQYVIEPVNIKPEHVTDYEIGVRYQRGSLFAALDYYREYFSDSFINGTDPITNLSFETNGGTSLYQGVELQLKNDFGKMGIADLSGYVNYSHNEAKFTSTFSGAEGNSGVAGEPLAGVPSDLLAIGVTYKGDNWQTTVFGQYVGSQFINQAFIGTPSSNQLPSYVDMDFTGSYDIPLEGVGGLRTLRLALQVSNLLDSHYFANAQTTSTFSKVNYIQVEPAAPRSVFGSVSVLF